VERDHCAAGRRVIPDSGLAALYGVTVSVFNQAARRNMQPFSADFGFQLTREEHETLRSQIVISKTERRGGRQYLPFAFTEHSAVMAASILNSPKAVEMSVEVTFRR
jgi:ORF6N domain